jgi:AraC-like DNA-binding protein
MTYLRPAGLLAGFHVDNPDPSVPEIIHGGEQWAPRDFFIHDHAHEQWEMYYQASGESIWWAASQDYRLGPADLLVVAPHTRHFLREVPLSKHHFFFVAVDLEVVFARLPALRQSWMGSPVVVMGGASSLLAPFRALTHELSMPSPFRSEGLRAALDSLVIHATRLMVTHPTPGGSEAQPPFVHPAVARARELLDTRYRDPWTVEGLSRLVGLSASHLAERFGKDIGVSPHAYLIQQRLSAAKELLATTDLAVSDIAQEVGMSSSQYLATVFRRVEGISPMKYRRSSAEPEAPAKP